MGNPELFYVLAKVAIARKLAAEPAGAMTLGYSAPVGAPPPKPQNMPFSGKPGQLNAVNLPHSGPAPGTGKPAPSAKPVAPSKPPAPPKPNMMEQPL